MQQQQRTTVIRGARVADTERSLAPHSDVLVVDGRIAELGAPGMAAPEDARVLDATDRLIIPGLVNAHTHGHGAIGKGLGDRWNLELLLNAGPWIGGGRNTEHKYLSTLVGALEMVSKGCTACYDLYFEYPLPTLEGMQAVARAYEDAGMRAVVAPMVADRTFYQAIPGLMDALPEPLRERVQSVALAPAERTLEACEHLLQHWHHDRERVRLALAPTIPLHCGDDFIVECARLAEEYDVGLQMHLGESKVQAVAGMTRYGKTLTAHLDGLGVLGPRFTGAHCIWLDDDDIRRFADRGASIAHNPGSNLRLGSGIAAARQMLDAGVNVGVGTDGAQCADNQNMFEAARLASFVSRIREHDPQRWVGTVEVLRMATRGSAEAMGFGDRLGRIAVGAHADLTFLDLRHVNWWPLNDVVNQLVHTEDGCSVDGVMTAGKVVLWEGRFTDVDTLRLRGRIAQAAEELLAANQDRRQLADALAGVVGEFCVGLASQPYHVHAMGSSGERGG